jgi:hypothetical protein
MSVPESEWCNHGYPLLALSSQSALHLLSPAQPQAQHMHPMCVDCGLNVSRLPRRWRDMVHECEECAPAHLLDCLARCMGLSCTDLEEYLLSVSSIAAPVAVSHDELLLWLRQLTPPVGCHVSHVLSNVVPLGLCIFSMTREFGVVFRHGHMFFICRSCSAAASETCFVFEYSQSFSCAWSMPCAMRGGVSQMPSVPAGQFQDQDGQYPVYNVLPMLGSRLRVVRDNYVCFVTYHMDMTGATLLRVLGMKGFQHPVGRIPKHAESDLHLQRPLCDQKFCEESVVFCRPAASRGVIAGRDGISLSFGIHPQMTGACLAKLFRQCGLQTGSRSRCTAQGPLGPLSGRHTLAVQGIYHGVLLLCK